MKPPRLATAAALVTLILSVATTPAHAKSIPKADALPSLGGISARELHLDKFGVLRYRWGSVAEMDQPDAIKACAVHGRHLPTIRELIKLNRSAGLVIQELSDDERWKYKDTGSYPQSDDESLHLIASKNPNGKKDLFYYNRNDYDRAEGDLRDTSYWSSSSSGDGAFSYLGHILIYDGIVGQGIRTTITNGDGTKVFGTCVAARCVK